MPPTDTPSGQTQETGQPVPAGQTQETGQAGTPAPKPTSGPSDEVAKLAKDVMNWKTKYLGIKEQLGETTARAAAAETKAAGVDDAANLLDAATGELAELKALRETFSALFQADLAELDEAGQAAVKALPGTDQQRLTWLRANRARFGTAQAVPPAPDQRQPGPRPLPVPAQQGANAALATRIETLKAEARKDPRKAEELYVALREGAPPRR